MKFTLQSLRESPCKNIWHDLIKAGKLIGASLEVPDPIAQSIMDRCGESAPPSAAVSQTSRSNHQPATPLPYAEWPLAFRMLSCLSHPGDTGLGDVIHRLTVAVGSNWVKRWIKKHFNYECRCPQRRLHLNLRYPLPPRSLT